MVVRLLHDLQYQ
ncbi:hypothetical protein E2C01_078388 [Portunus trituberculatus]|uniref:Uncharacterized protein n=2 Tax=Pleocyemata TaxID=6692 RepID=A0A5B7IMH0_PORTR|nr:hypothetical protein [Portunus trituberculatus]